MIPIGISDIADRVVMPDGKASPELLRLLQEMIARLEGMEDVETRLAAAESQLASLGQYFIPGLFTVAGLTSAYPPASSPGARAYVTDATAPVYGRPLVGGGAAGSPAVSDGANWEAG